MDATNERRCTIALKSIAKSLERIATAMEKENAPSGEGSGQIDGKKLLEIVERNFGSALHSIVGSDGVSDKHTDDF